MVPGTVRCYVAARDPVAPCLGVRSIPSSRSRRAPRRVGPEVHPPREYRDRWEAGYGDAAGSGAWAAVFARMSGVLLSEQTVTTVLELITSLAKDTLPGSAGAGGYPRSARVAAGGRRRWSSVSVRCSTSSARDRV